MNIVSATTMALIHIAQDRQVMKRVRCEVNTAFGNQPLSSVSIKELSKLPLLSCVFAETLRLHVKSFTVVSPPHEDVHLGRYLFPKGSIGLLSSGVSHTDRSFWNTKEGAHPVSSFWADRFLMDPSDPSSGPRIPGYENTAGPEKERYKRPRDIGARPYFSTEGLQESWYPFGGK